MLRQFFFNKYNFGKIRNSIEIALIEKLRPSHLKIID
jgi:hypothetical protein